MDFRPTVMDSMRHRAAQHTETLATLERLNAWPWQGLLESLDALGDAWAKAGRDWTRMMRAHKQRLERQRLRLRLCVFVAAVGPWPTSPVGPVPKRTCEG